VKEASAVEAGGEEGVECEAVGGGLGGEAGGDGAAVEGESLAGEKLGAGGLGALLGGPAGFPAEELGGGLTLGVGLGCAVEDTERTKAFVLNAYFPHDRYGSA
jgi:hypothetical protein